MTARSLQRETQAQSKSSINIPLLKTKERRNNRNQDQNLGKRNRMASTSQALMELIYQCPSTRTNMWQRKTSHKSVMLWQALTLSKAVCSGNSGSAPLILILKNAKWVTSGAKRVWNAILKMLLKTVKIAYTQKKTHSKAWFQSVEVAIL